MNAHAAWRGERRLRVSVEIGARSVQVLSLRMLDGPAVQRPSLDGTHVAQITMDGQTILFQSFDDLFLVRGSARPEAPGHSYARTDRALVHVDVPIPAGGPPGEIAIRIFDISKVRNRPTDPEQIGRLLDSSPKTLRMVARVTTADLVAHPDWAAAGLPGGQSSATGWFEVYVDRAGKYRWRLRRSDGQIIANSGQGFRSRADCEADLRWIRQHAVSAPVRALDTK